MSQIQTQIKKIYQDFQTPKNLQEHMLSVAGLAKIITTNWTGKEIDASAIIDTCLLHDIAKPMMFDLTKQAQFGMTQDEINEVAKLQERLKTNYGTSEHEVAVMICKELGCTPKTVELIDNFEWKYVPRLLESNDIESLIPVYCDMRIAPNGIMTIKERNANLQSRHPEYEGLDELEKAGKQLEAILQKNVTVNLNEITSGDLKEHYV